MTVALTHPGKDEFDIDPQFSPNGEWIAYEARHGRAASGSGWSDPTARRTTGSRSRCEDPCIVVGAPTWISSNRRLAVVRVLGPFDANDNAAEALLWTIRTSTGPEARRLSPKRAPGSTRTPTCTPRGTGAIWSPACASGSPTGRRPCSWGWTATAATAALITPWGWGVEINDVSTAASGPTEDLVVFEAYGRGDPDATFVDLGTVPATVRDASGTVAGDRLAHRQRGVRAAQREPALVARRPRQVFTDRRTSIPRTSRSGPREFGTDQRRQISDTPALRLPPGLGRA